MNGFKVGDDYRTNPLSLKPGGYEVTVNYNSGKFLVYDKVKYPGAYIKHLEESGKNERYGHIVEVKVDNAVVWTQASPKGRKPWEIDTHTQQSIPFVDPDINMHDDLPF